MDDPTGKRESSALGDDRSQVLRRVAWALMCLLILIVLPLLPLAMEFVEHAAVGTHYTSVLFQKLGMFDALSALYSWLGLIG